MNLRLLVEKTEDINERLVRTVQWRDGKRQVKLKTDRAGYKSNDGKEVKMKGTEKRNRRLGSKRAARKKRAISAQIERHRERTLRIRGDR
jgi:hypothetical protein